MAKLEELKLEKLNADSMQKVYGGLAGPGDDWDTGCSDAPDCCTGGLDTCPDSEPMELGFKVNPDFGFIPVGVVSVSFPK